MIDRRGFLGAVAVLATTGRWLRPRPAVKDEMDLAAHVMGFSTSPPLHPNCRCVLTTTWQSPHPALEPGDVISLTLPDDQRPTYYTLMGVSDFGRRLTMRERPSMHVDMGRVEPTMALWPAHRDVRLT